MTGSAVRDPRSIAFSILRRVDREEAYASLLLQAMPSSVDPRDARLVTELVYGVLRKSLYLDHVVSSFASRPVGAIDPDLLIVLRLGLHQLLHLDRIPVHAAVGESVRLARASAGGKRADAAAAFVNGVLRAVARDRARVPLPPIPAPGEDPAPALAVAESHPEWLVRRWIAGFGADRTARLLASQNRPAPIALRANRRVATSDQVARSLASESVVTEPGRFLEDFLVVTDGAPQATRAFAQGGFYIQDEASGLVARLAGWGSAMEGARALDCCAAPGGKTFMLAEAVGESGVVVAGDRHASRLRLLIDNARRLGVGSCLPLAADFSAAAPFSPGAVFDVVMVDAPCSGTGVIRRSPELRYRVSAEKIDRLAALQAALLSRAAALVRPGGALVYAVCSLEPEEGAHQVPRFLQRNPGYHLEDPRPLLPAAARDLVARAGEGEGGSLATFPDRDGLDGFFAVRFRRA